MQTRQGPSQELARRTFLGHLGDSVREELEDHGVGQAEATIIGMAFAIIVDDAEADPNEVRTRIGAIKDLHSMLTSARKTQRDDRLAEAKIRALEVKTSVAADSADAEDKPTAETIRRKMADRMQRADEAAQVSKSWRA